MRILFLILSFTMLSSALAGERFSGAEYSLIDCHTAVADKMGMRKEYAIMIPAGISGKIRGSLLLTIYDRYPDEVDRPRHATIPADVDLEYSNELIKVLLDSGKIGEGRTSRYQLAVTHTELTAVGKLTVTTSQDIETQHLTCRVVAWD